MSGGREGGKKGVVWRECKDREGDGREREGLLSLFDKVDSIKREL